MYRSKYNNSGSGGGARYKSKYPKNYFTTGKGGFGRGGSQQTKPRYVKPVITDTAVTQQVRTYLDPFSTATTNPKIPDGKCTLSVGLRLQAVRELSVAESDGEMHIFLQPGLMHGVTVYGMVQPPAGTTDNPNTYGYTNGSLSSLADTPMQRPVIMKYPNHQTMRVLRDTSSINDDSASLFSNTVDINQWRLVSQGLVLSLINNNDENDGWFEAIRFVPGHPADLYSMFTKRPPDNNGTNAVDVDVGVSNGFDTNDRFGNLVENPSYITGKIRDLHKYKFTLKPHDTDHPFVKTKNNIVCREPSKNYFLPEIVYSEISELLASVIDSSYDCIYIRIHGRPVSTDESGTRLMAHIVSNQELMYDTNTSLARFHSKSNVMALFKDRVAAAHATRTAAGSLTETTPDYTSSNSNTLALQEIDPIELQDTMLDEVANHIIPEDVPSNENEILEDIAQDIPDIDEQVGNDDSASFDDIVAQAEADEEEEEEKEDMADDANEDTADDANEDDEDDEDDEDMAGYDDMAEDASESESENVIELVQQQDTEESDVFHDAFQQPIIIQRRIPRTYVRGNEYPWPDQRVLAIKRESRHVIDGNKKRRVS